MGKSSSASTSATWTIIRADVAFEETVRDLLAMYDIDPAELTVVHDLHPQFRSTRFADLLPAAPARGRATSPRPHRQRAGRTRSVRRAGGRRGARRHRLRHRRHDLGRRIFRRQRATGFERGRWLRPVRMPGGDAAAQFPVQAAAGFLADLAEAVGRPICRT